MLLDDPNAYPPLPSIAAPRAAITARQIESGLTMSFVLDAASPSPLHEQLRIQLIEQVRSGELPAGAKLPTVRGLAEELSVAPNTIAKAYRELEADDIIETRGRAGTFVSTHGDVTHQQAQVAARAYADRIRELNLPADDAISLVTAAIRR